MTKLMSTGFEEEEHMPVSSLLSCARALKAETWDTVSMDRDVFILFSEGAE